MIGNTINLWALGGSIGNPAGTNDLEIDSSNGASCALSGAFDGTATCTIGARATNSIFMSEVNDFHGPTPQNQRSANVVLLEALNGDIRFTVRETSSQGEDLNLLHTGDVRFAQTASESVAHGLIHAPNGSITLRAGDNVTTDPAGATQTTPSGSV